MSISIFQLHICLIFVHHIASISFRNLKSFRRASSQQPAASMSQEESVEAPLLDIQVGNTK